MDSMIACQSQFETTILWQKHVLSRIKVRKWLENIPTVFVQPSSTQQG